MTEMRPSSYPLVTVAEATKIIAGFVKPLASVSLPLSEAGGRVLATDILSDVDSPRWRSSSVDGYAVLASDEAEWRSVLAELTAGKVDEVSVAPGTAVRIMTGSPVPEGADAVAMVEDTEEVAGKVHIRRRPSSGENVLPIGLDLKVGQTVLPHGTAVGPAEMGILASLGLARVQVYRRPRVAILTTGDEIVPATETPGPGQIRDSNHPALIQAVLEAGGEPVSLGIARDDLALQRAAIERGLASADLVISSGGVSVGSKDHIKGILSELGKIHFGRVSVKPGKPLTFATAGTALYFGLPGFPVSTLVMFEVFVRPVLRAMQGYAGPGRPKVMVVTGEALKPSPDRTEYQRAVVSLKQGRLTAASTGIQVSSRLLSMVGANALIIIPPGMSLLPAGSEVDALLTGDLAT